MPVAKQPGAALGITSVDWPLYRLHRIPLCVAHTGQTADIKGALAVILKPRQRRMFAEDGCRMRPGKAFMKAQTLGDLRE